jgi:hypothetical protein
MHKIKGSAFIKGKSNTIFVFQNGRLKLPRLKVNTYMDEFILRKIKYANKVF